MSARLKQLKEKRAELYARMKKLTDTADAENRDFNDAEEKDFSSMETEYEGIKNRIEREERLRVIETENAAPSRRPEVEPTGSTEPESRGSEKKKVWGSLAEQLQAVIRAGTPGGAVDKRLVEVRAATGLNEGTPSDGGFLVQTDFSTELLKRAYDKGFLASRVRRIPLSANSNGIVINAIDESSRATGSRMGGVQAYWVAEAGTVSPAKPKMRQIKLNVHKLMGLCYATEEMLADSTALENIITESFADEFAFVIDDAIIRGDGAGKPKGFLGHPSQVSVAKESGQAAATVLKDNIVKMRARLWARSRPNSVWLINQDVEPQLQLLTLGDLGVYFPAGSFTNQPLDQLFGRPVMPIEQAETLGTKGDIMLVDPTQYVMIDKGAPEGASSVHVRFLYDEQVFKFTYRVDGQPIWNLPLTPYKGSNTQSPFITLDTRA